MRTFIPGSYLQTLRRLRQKAALTVQKIQVKETTQLLAVIPQQEIVLSVEMQQETVLSVEITLHRKRKMMLPVVCHRRSHLTVRTDRSL